MATPTSVKTVASKPAFVELEEIEDIPSIDVDDMFEKDIVIQELVPEPMYATIGPEPQVMDVEAAMSEDITREEKADILKASRPSMKHKLPNDPMDCNIPEHRIVATFTKPDTEDTMIRVVYCMDTALKESHWYDWSEPGDDAQVAVRYGVTGYKSMTIPDDDKTRKKKLIHNANLEPIPWYRQPYLGAVDSSDDRIQKEGTDIPVYDLGHLHDHDIIVGYVPNGDHAAALKLVMGDFDGRYPDVPDGPNLLDKLKETVEGEDCLNLKKNFILSKKDAKVLKKGKLLDCIKNLLKDLGMDVGFIGTLNDLNEESGVVDDVVKNFAEMSFDKGFDDVLKQGMDMGTSLGVNLVSVLAKGVMKSAFVGNVATMATGLTGLDSSKLPAMDKVVKATLTKDSVTKFMKGEKTLIANPVSSIQDATGVTTSKILEDKVGYSIQAKDLSAIQKTVRNGSITKLSGTLSTMEIKKTVFVSSAMDPRLINQTRAKATKQASTIDINKAILSPPQKPVGIGGAVSAVA